jgi:hypothetical protein
MIVKQGNKSKGEKGKRMANNRPSILPHTCCMNTQTSGGNRRREETKIHEI